MKDDKSMRVMESNEKRMQYLERVGFKHITMSRRLKKDKPKVVAPLQSTILAA
jgi:hypothetical protein